MSGGACVGAAVFALEAHTDRPLIQLSAQFLSAPPNGTTATLSVATIKSGRSITQATSKLEADGVASVNVLGTFGSRDPSIDRQWQPVLDVEPPDNCPRLAFIREDEQDLHTHLDIRQVSRHEQTAQGSLVFWVRSPKEVSSCAVAPFLAVIADYLPEAIHKSIGSPAGATSLDNQLRVLSRDLTQWTLCQVSLAGIAHGVCHGRISLYNQSGDLLAMGEQSAVVILF